MSSASTRRTAPHDGPRERQRRIGYEARIDSIASAARAVFAESGYQAASMREIANRAGVTKSTLYEYFDSKRALHIWLLDREREALNALGAEVMAGTGSSERRVQRAFSAFFEYVERNPYALRMLFRETTGDPEIAAAQRRIHAEAADAIARMLLDTADVAESASVVDRPAALGELLRGGLHALALWWQEHPDARREELVALCMDVYWSGIDRLRKGRAWSSRNVVAPG